MNSLAPNMVVIPDIAGPVVDDGSEPKLLAISEMSENFGVTLRTLRFYEEKGLINPVRKGARRFYSARDVGRMRVILQAKKIGLTLTEIRRVLKLVESSTPRRSQLEELRGICASQQDMLREQHALLQEQVAEVDHVMQSLDRLIAVS
ncbi:MerR family transcriptional regulator [Pannonibacter sp. Q-1]|uniref:MerR family transcriptional regulator n=2 Tax=Pannonibacter phragmitetus TaxID=121719 RepID=A0A0L0IUP5_9HYPH|nr:MULTISPECIES: MerR family transcriptional regulator [Pannonibacter]ALV28020.1 MerR family transcriptional regulator [Pannonibacter phragmitetus]KND16795.1 MerR family transcriptional regulator [Pannonibacter phragmitetus]